MKQNFKKLAVVLHVLQTTQNWSFHVVVLQRMAEKCTKIFYARAQPLFCSLNLLSSDVAVAVDVGVILIPYYMQKNWEPCLKQLERDYLRNKAFMSDQLSYPSSSLYKIHTST